MITSPVKAALVLFPQAAACPFPLRPLSPPLIPNRKVNDLSSSPNIIEIVFEGVLEQEHTEENKWKPYAGKVFE